MRNRLLLLEMAGETKTVNLKNSAEPEMFYFDPPYITDSIKVTV
jgi:site-specific DNA-adenine methylase